MSFRLGRTSCTRSPSCSRRGRAPPTVCELFEAWLAHAEGRLEVATMLGYRSVVRQLVPLVGDLDVRQLTAADLDQLYGQLLAGGRSPRTGHRAHRGL